MQKIYVWFISFFFAHKANFEVLKFEVLKFVFCQIKGELRDLQI